MELQKFVAIMLVSSLVFFYNGYQSACEDVSECLKEFREDFWFGVASSAYQIEGAWNESGRAISSWDHFTHTKSHIILDKGNGDIASDSYHKTEEDVGYVKYLGVDYYRFSLSWPRILPTSNKVNNEGIAYYNRLIDLLLENNIQPMVTIFHWDLPQDIQNLGGFINPEIANLFVRYAKVAFEHFGDRVKLWSTFNEPKIFCMFGYGDVIFAPGINQSGFADYLCGHNILKAHAKAYHLYNNEYRAQQNGRISLNLDSPWGEPATNSVEDLAAAERYMQFELGWFAHPVFSKEGDYPSEMKKIIAEHSKQQGYARSRLPAFTQEEIDYIRGTHDFFYLNHYITVKVAFEEMGTHSATSYDKDKKCRTFYDNSWGNTTSEFFKVVPWALTKLLSWIKEEYGNPEIYITENGYADKGDIIDTPRISYYKEYLKAVLEAICIHGVNVRAYTAWSLLDSFEWFVGYTGKFGFYHVNFTDPMRKRTPKSSAAYYKNVILTRKP